MCLEVVSVVCRLLVRKLCLFSLFHEMIWDWLWVACSYPSLLVLELSTIDTCGKVKVVVCMVSIDIKRGRCENPYPLLSFSIGQVSTRAVRGLSAGGRQLDRRGS